MVRECRLAYITRAGVEIGVASTKAFTTPLAGLYLVLPGEEIRSTPGSELSWWRLRVLMRLADPVARQWYAAQGGRSSLECGRAGAPDQHAVLRAPAIQP